MPAIDFDYDPRETNANNIIGNEQVTVNVLSDRSVFPQHGSFYGHSFVMRGRVTAGTGAWATLEPNVDYVFSPLYPSATAATGKEVFTYVVMVKDYGEVQYDYNVLGQYSDEVLIGWLTNNIFDRSQLVNWFKVKGDSINNHPQARHPETIDRSDKEVLFQGLERIFQAINNPHSTTTMTPAELTQLQINIASAASTTYVDSYFERVTDSPVAVNANVATLIYTIPDDAMMMRATILFTGANGELDSMDVMILNDGAVPQYTTYGRLNNTGAMFSLTAIQSAGEVRLLAQPSVNGIFKIKATAEF